MRWDSAALDLGGKTSDFYKIPIFLQNPAENTKKKPKFLQEKWVSFLYLKVLYPKMLDAPDPVQRILLFAPFIVILQDI